MMIYAKTKNGRYWTTNGWWNQRIKQQFKPDSIFIKNLINVLIDEKANLIMVEQFYFIITTFQDIAFSSISGPDSIFIQNLINVLK